MSLETKSKLTYEYTNEHGEVMTLVKEKDNKMFFKHTDISDEFEPINHSNIEKTVLKYSFNTGEERALMNFVKMAELSFSDKTFIPV